MSAAAVTAPTPDGAFERLSPAAIPGPHPLAAAFPELSPGEYLAFATDVRNKRAIAASVLLFEGLVLDGRARAKAARELGLALPARHYEGDDPIGALVSLNLARRHLDESQRAMVAASLATLRRGRPPVGKTVVENPSIEGISQSQAASILRVSPVSVERARQVQRNGIPALAAKVVSGELAVSRAAEISRLPADRQEAEIIAFYDHRAIRRAGKAIRAEAQAVKRAGRLERIAAIASRPAPFPDGERCRYPVIYADPPWEDEVWSEETGQDRGAANHYPTESLAQIRARPVGELAADDALLLLWCTNSRLADGIDLLRHWGFRYVSSVVWAKPNIGLGRWVRTKHEVLLFGSRGHGLPAPIPGSQMNSVFEAPTRGHSVKPDAPALWVESAYPNLPRIELYARVERARPGWDVWGYEAGSAEPDEERVAS